jgi:hypothetical protein
MDISYSLTQVGPNPSKPLQGCKRLGKFPTQEQAQRHADELGLKPGTYFIGETFSAPGVGKYFTASK